MLDSVLRVCWHWDALGTAVGFLPVQLRTLWETLLDPACAITCSGAGIHRHWTGSCPFFPSCISANSVTSATSERTPTGLDCSPFPVAYEIARRYSSFRRPAFLCLVLARFLRHHPGLSSSPAFRCSSPQATTHPDNRPRERQGQQRSLHRCLPSPADHPEQDTSSCRRAVRLLPVDQLRQTRNLPVVELLPASVASAFSQSALVGPPRPRLLCPCRWTAVHPQTNCVLFFFFFFGSVYFSIKRDNATLRNPQSKALLPITHPAIVFLAQAACSFRRPSPFSRPSSALALGRHYTIAHPPPKRFGIPSSIKPSL